MGRLTNFFKLNPEIDTLVLASWDAAFSSDANFLYFSGCGIDRATLIAHRNQAPALLCNQMNYELAQEKFSGEVVRFEPDEYRKKLVSLLSHSKSIGISKGGVSASLYENLRKSTKARLSDVSDLLLLQRSIKEEKEIEAIRHACAISRKILTQLEVRAGKTEAQLYSELQSITYSLGAEPAFAPIILSGRNSKFPHGKSGSRRLQKGDILLVDWGAKWENYCSDFTRCVFVGEPNHAEEKAYEKLHDVSTAILRFLRSGVSTKEVAKFAAERVAEAKLPAMPHNIGHGIGLDVHEFPSFAKKSGHKLRKGNVIAIEPAAYFKNFGVRFENTILLRKKAELL